MTGIWGRGCEFCRQPHPPHSTQINQGHPEQRGNPHPRSHPWRHVPPPCAPRGAPHPSLPLQRGPSPQHTAGGSGAPWGGGSPKIPRPTAGRGALGSTQITPGLLSEYPAHSYRTSRPHGPAAGATGSPACGMDQQPMAPSLDGPPRWGWHRGQHHPDPTAGARVMPQQQDVPAGVPAHWVTGVCTCKADQRHLVPFPAPWDLGLGARSPIGKLQM